MSNHHDVAPFLGNREDSMTRRTMSRLNEGVVLSLALLFVSACGGKANKGQPSAQPSAAPSASAAPSGSASPSVPVDLPPEGTGVTKVTPVDKGKCAVASYDLATYLQRGDLTIASHDGQIAASWLVQLKDKAQIGFAGFDGQAKRVARDRGIGNAQEHPPNIFPSGTDWIVTWIDPEGLAYARPRWEAQPGPEINHLTTVKDVAPDDLALAATPDGALVVASPFGTQGDQLSLFLFATPDGSQKAQALGFTKHAKKPRKPAVAADADGYALVWLEEDGSVAATRLDKTGKETGSSGVVAPPSTAGDRSRLTLVTTATGFELVWSDGDTVLARPLTKEAGPAGAPLLVGKGHDPRPAPGKEGLFIAYLGEADGKPNQLIVTKVGDQVSATATRISDGLTDVKDPPAIVMAGDRLAMAWTEVMSPSVSTKRATLRTIDAACLP